MWSNQNSPRINRRLAGLTRSRECRTGLRHWSHNLRSADQPYENVHKFGNGSNWQLRLLKVDLELDADHTLKYGNQREVYVMPIASNSRAFPSGIDAVLEFDHVSAKDISELAIRRWVLARAKWDLSSKELQRKDFELESLRSFGLAAPGHGGSVADRQPRIVMTYNFQISRRICLIVHSRLQSGRRLHSTMIRPTRIRPTRRFVVQ